MVTLTSSATSKTTFDMINDNNNNNSLRDVSFSSYLNNEEETHVQKLGESSRSLKGLNVLSPQDELQHNSTDYSRMKKDAEDSEIRVFGAEKYFNGEMDSDNTPRLVSPTNLEVYRNVKNEKVVVNSRADTKSAGTPSVHSESSWNSQRALLQSAAKNSNQISSFRKTEKKTNKKSFLANLGCNCSCSDENSVDVDENISAKKSTNSDLLVQDKAARRLNSPMKINGLSRQNPFTFPVMNSELGIANLGSNPKILVKEEEGEEIQRKSLEQRNMSLSTEQKLTILPWDLNPRIKEDEFSTNYEDSGSDASSDLFEIESLTEKPKSFLARQGSDPASPPTGYAPSEASIEWSVVTASAADFSVMSDNEEPRKNLSMKYPNSNIKSNKDRQRRNSTSLLLGCKSQKSVRVSSDSYRTTNQNTNYDPRVSESFRATTRFHADTKPTGFEARNKIASRSISLSPSPRASGLLFIQ